MRISVDFKTSRFPQANGMMICSLLKESLKKTNEEYFRKLYIYEDKKSKRTKNFTFSIYVKDYELQDGIFTVKDKITLNISTPDYECGINLYNALLNAKEFNYKNYTLYKQSIKLIREKQITEEEVNFKTLSPIYIKDKNNNSLEPDYEDFEKELNYISDIVLKQYRGYGLKKDIHFTKVDMKRRVVKMDITDFKDKTNKDIMYLNAYNGVFKLCGDIEDLRDLYMLGIGFRRNEGLGMIEVF
ncbi:CRISPR-associated endoribonuclease Cas6 [Clostridium aciditolerans]|nr:CRISPR-associated endoribonuclease Cas6 [Clostridium aciditolerans]